jgi:hypothetical protein
MGEKRGVRRNLSVASTVTDDATRKAIFAVEDRLKAIERRIATPTIYRSTLPTNFPASTTCTAITIIDTQTHVSLETTGGLVELWFAPQSNKIGSDAILSFGGTSSSGIIEWWVFRDEQLITSVPLGVAAGGASSMTITIPWGQMRFIDAVPAGNYVYKTQFKVTGNGTFRIAQYELSVMEIFPIR